MNLSLLLQKNINPKKEYNEAHVKLWRRMDHIGRKHVQLRNDITRDFDTEITFEHSIREHQGKIDLEVRVQQGGESALIWNMLDVTGSPPHRIVPRNPRGILAFRWNGPGSYKPHTSPGGRYGGPGLVQGGDMVFVTGAIDHPGFPPRNLSAPINRRLNSELESDLQRDP